MVCVSCMFIYDAVDVNKIVAVVLPKPPTYAQVMAGLKLYLDRSADGEHYKPNLNFIQTEVMASACSFFSIVTVQINFLVLPTV